MLAGLMWQCGKLALSLKNNTAAHKKQKKQTKALVGYWQDLSVAG